MDVARTRHRDSWRVVVLSFPSAQLNEILSLNFLFLATQFLVSSFLVLLATFSGSFAALSAHIKDPGVQLVLLSE